MCEWTVQLSGTIDVAYVGADPPDCGLFPSVCSALIAFRSAATFAAETSLPTNEYPGL